MSFDEGGIGLTEEDFGAPSGVGACTEGLFRRKGGAGEVGDGEKNLVIGINYKVLIDLNIVI